ncbi:MAG: hypothetical protein IKR40_09440 [Treponema sp.]|nr:hypothetical protein [Treponema sp.]
MRWPATIARHTVVVLALEAATDFVFRTVVVSVQTLVLWIVIANVQVLAAEDVKAFQQDWPLTTIR